MANPTSTLEAALEVVRRLRERGHVAYFAGGCVRDQLMGLTPKDYDVATSAPPTAVREMFRNTQPVGAAFGVILVRIGAGVQIEVATFRTDGSYTDGRRPDSVRFASAEEDARRRDFTINGLFLDPISGEVIDFVGGRADLAARVLRAIGDADARLAEDHLRLMRAVRFAARFGLALEPATASAVRRHAGSLRKIAPERVGDELRRILVSPTRGVGAELMRELGLTAEVFRFMDCAERPSLKLLPALAPGREIGFPAGLVAMMLEETVEAGADGSVESAVLWAMSDERVRAAVTALRQSLRLSNDEVGAFEEILTSLRGVLEAEAPGMAVRRRFLARATARSGESTAVLEAMAEAGLFADRIGRLRVGLTELADGDNAPPPLLTGDDLVAQGLRPGPVFRRLLELTYDAQLEGRVTTREEAMALALSQV